MVEVGGAVDIAGASRLRRPQPLKTFRVNLSALEGQPHFHADVRVDAESREAALAKLSEALEEIEP